MPSQLHYQPQRPNPDPAPWVLLGNPEMQGLLGSGRQTRRTARNSACLQVVVRTLGPNSSASFPAVACQEMLLGSLQAKYKGCWPPRALLLDQTPDPPHPAFRVPHQPPRFLWEVHKQDGERNSPLLRLPCDRAERLPPSAAGGRRTPPPRIAFLSLPCCLSPATFIHRFPIAVSGNSCFLIYPPLDLVQTLG